MSLSRGARTAITHIENHHLEVLASDVVDVLFTKIAVKDCKILDGARQYVICAEGAVTKANMLSRRFAAAAPLTVDGWFAGHVMG